MEQLLLKATPRKETGKGPLKSLRNEGKLPGVIYGKDFENTPVFVDYKEFFKIIKKHGETAIIDLEFQGDNIPVMMKEVQKDTLKRAIVHVDFLKISLTEKIEIKLPVVLRGEAEGVKEGGTLQHQLREITAKVLPRDIPEHIEVDINGLHIGDVVTLGDIEIDDKIEVLDSPDEVIVTVLAPMKEEELEEELVVDEHVEEPEVIAKGKEKEEGEEETEEE
jgi:large subunit ribosomal protein L25